MTFVSPPTIGRRPLPLRFAWRELRAGLGGFRIFLACIALGVMAIAGVASSTQSLVDGLARDGRVILGGDAAFTLIHREASAAERDALIADISPRHLRGASFGLRQSLDTAGAFAGPLLAILFMWLLANDIVAVFWLAVAPAFLAMFFIIFGVHEPERPAGSEKE